MKPKKRNRRLRIAAVFLPMFLEFLAAFYFALFGTFELH